MNTFGDLVLSQTALQDYVECPRRFELRYLRQLNWPALETRQARRLEAISRLAPGAPKPWEA